MGQYEKIPAEGYPINSLTSTPQNCQGHQNQGKSKKLSSSRRDTTNVNKYNVKI